MRRGKLGDVYYIKVPNGYKLYQWAYKIPKYGDFIRVFPGLYKELPENIKDIILARHSYIIEFFSNRAYRIGLAQFIGNYPVPDEYPYPDLKFNFVECTSGEIAFISIMRTNGTLDDCRTFYVSRMKDLPPCYQNLTLLNSYIPPSWLLYLFDTDWSPEKLQHYDPDPSGRERKEILQKYQNIIDGFSE